VSNNSKFFQGGKSILLSEREDLLGGGAVARTYDAATTSPERALEWLRRWYDVSGALKVEDLAARIGLDYEYMLLPRQVTGCLVYEGKGRFIALINRRLSVPKRRMALAHAMGHWSMHPVQS